MNKCSKCESIIIELRTVKNMRCHRLLISRQYLFNNSWNTFELSGNERKKVSNVIFVFFWGTEVEKKQSDKHREYAIKSKH